MDNKLEKELNRLFYKKPNSKDSVSQQIIELYNNSLEQRDILDVYIISFMNHDKVLLDYRVNINDGEYHSVLIYFTENYPNEKPFTYNNKDNFYQLRIQNDNVSLDNTSLRIRDHKAFITAIESIRYELIIAKNEYNKLPNDIKEKKKIDYYTKEKSDKITGYDCLREDLCRRIAPTELKDFVKRNSAQSKSFKEKLMEKEFLKEAISDDEIKRLLITDLVNQMKDKYKQKLMDEKFNESTLINIRAELSEKKKKTDELMELYTNGVGQVNDMIERLGAVKLSNEMNLEKIESYQKLVKDVDPSNTEKFVNQIVKINGKNINENKQIEYLSILAVLEDLNAVIKKLFDKGVFSFDLCLKLTRKYTRYAFVFQHMINKEIEKEIKACKEGSNLCYK